jgi:50S ribosomal protein L16 3-hydroxylase
MLELENFDSNDFLENYWQQKPLLIRGALPHFDNPVSPEELAGLACEEELESRIITETEGNWDLKQGPFTEQEFLALAPENWTVLVQAVDQWIPEVRTLLDYFRFLPSWRIDDVMASFATKGGNAGPHYDEFSVFLIQGLGRRHWQVGDKCSAKDKHQQNEQLRLLADFKYSHAWTLDVGDVLYLPPGYAHWGVAETDHCMTYSVGFRAPSYAEMLSHFCDHQIHQLDDSLRYSDPRLSHQIHSGEISESAIKTVQHILNGLINDPDQLKKWFGGYVTEPKYPSIEDPLISDIHFEEIKNKILEQSLVLRNPQARFAFTHTGTGGILFVDGKTYELSQSGMPLVELLTGHEQFQSSVVLERVTNQESAQLLTTLFNEGYLYCEEQLFD